MSSSSCIELCKFCGCTLCISGLVGGPVPAQMGLVVQGYSSGKESSPVPLLVAAEVEKSYRWMCSAEDSGVCLHCSPVLTEASLAPSPPPRSPEGSRSTPSTEPALPMDPVYVLITGSDGAPPADGSTTD